MRKIWLFVAVVIVILHLGTGATATEVPTPAAAPQVDEGPSRTGFAITDWIGRSEEELISKWGEPSRVRRLKNDERMLVYKVDLYDGSLIVPGVTIPLPTSSIAGSRDPHIDHRDYSGPYGDAGSVHTPGSAQVQAAGKLKARFRLDAEGTIINAEIKGPKQKKEAE